ncbi:hypothetical protein [Fructobacillus parabroussonetiae]|uniref:Uncharacterized protein n=1 Tax=Fructobacillus parabroussonetiae TaxID=2713174 RepID=A0ABS5QXF3_9LACO|nr:hypothetical protein [Fructobacillus parabroussonetiae]MBS9336959.1 hypothetical protein [Fructobacillus parabroussonetiae]
MTITRKKILWTVLLLVVATAATTAVLIQHGREESKRAAAAKSESIKNRKAVQPLLNIKSGQTKAVNGLKIQVESIAKTDYKAYGTRSVAKFKLKMTNTTKSNLYIVAAAPHGAFDAGFADSENWNLTGVATDNISAKYWTPSISLFTNDKGDLKDKNLISDQLRKKSGVTLGVGANYKYLCWKLKPGQTIAGNAYGVYDANPDKPDQLPVLKVNSDQIGVPKSTVDLYRDEYKREVKEGTEREKAIKEEQEAEANSEQQATDDNAE